MLTCQDKLEDLPVIRQSARLQVLTTSVFRHIELIFFLNGPFYTKAWFDRFLKHFSFYSYNN